MSHGSVVVKTEPGELILYHEAVMIEWARRNSTRVKLIAGRETVTSLLERLTSELLYRLVCFEPRFPKSRL